MVIFWSITGFGKSVHRVVWEKLLALSGMSYRWLSTWYHIQVRCLLLLSMHIGWPIDIQCPQYCIQAQTGYEPRPLPGLTHLSTFCPTHLLHHHICLPVLTSNMSEKFMITRLTGSENYTSWSVDLKIMLKHHWHWSWIEGVNEQPPLKLVPATAPKATPCHHRLHSQSQ